MAEMMMMMMEAVVVVVSFLCQWGLPNMIISRISIYLYIYIYVLYIDMTGYIGVLKILDAAGYWNPPPANPKPSSARRCGSKTTVILTGGSFPNTKQKDFSCGTFGVFRNHHQP